MLDEDQSAGHEAWRVWVPHRTSGGFKCVLKWLKIPRRSSDAGSPSRNLLKTF